MNNLRTVVYKGRYYLLLLLFTILLMTLCSAASPLYVIQDWTDANTYFTMGKGIVHGAVPYRDLFDHKGPYLYFLYAIAYLIHHTKFTGVFLLQILSMYLTLICLFKTADLFLENRKRALFSALLVTYLVFAADTYYVPSQLDMGGGSPEEFCLPFLALSLYLLTLQYKQQRFSARFMLCHGVMMGCVCLIKFNFLLYWVGLLLPTYIALLYHKRIACFFKGILWAALGLAAALLPYGIYALATDSLSDFLFAYIKFNSMYAHNDHSLSVRIMDTLSKAQDYLLSGFLIALLFIGGLFYIVFVCRKFTMSYRFSLVGGFCALLFAVFFGQVWGYSRIPFLIFSLFGFIAFFSVVPRFSMSQRLSDTGKRGLCLLLSMVVLVVVVNNNKMLITKDKNKPGRTIVTCQQEIADIIKGRGDEGASVLEIGMLNRAFYTVLDVVPNRKYFYKPNISYEEFPEILDSQLAYVEEQAADYVIITAGKEPMELDKLTGSDINTKINRTILENYSLVAIVKGTGINSSRYFHLYYSRAAHDG